MKFIRAFLFSMDCICLIVGVILLGLHLYDWNHTLGEAYTLVLASLLLACNLTIGDKNE